MKRRNYKGLELLPLAVSDAAPAGGDSFSFDWFVLPPP